MKRYVRYIIFVLIVILATGLLIHNNPDIHKEKIYALYNHTSEPKKDIKRKKATLRNHMDRTFMVIFKQRVERQARTFPQLFFLESLSNKKKIALTFDDGPHPIITPRVLAALNKHKIKGTFFMYGKSIAVFPSLVKKVESQGHSIGMHSYYHKNMLYMQARRAYIIEIETVQAMITRLTGKKPFLFRPPFGIITDDQLRYFAKKGIKVIDWSVDSFDWRYGYESRWAISKTVLRYAHPGAIVLMHDACRRNCHIDEALDTIITTLKKRGYTFCTVDELLDF